MLLMCPAPYEVILSLFSKSKNPVGREEVGQGGAPEPRLENLWRTDTLDEGGAHCWKGSFVGITPPPFSPSPLPMHTQIQFSYIFSTAYHVIVETYAHWCADMCAGPGSTGRLRDTWCTDKTLLILLLLSPFPPVFLQFPLCFSFLSALVSSLSFHFQPAAQYS